MTDDGNDTPSGKTEGRQFMTVSTGPRAFSAQHAAMGIVVDAMFTDASMVQADASNNSVVNQQSLKRYLNKSYRQLEARLEQQKEHEDKSGIKIEFWLQKALFGNGFG